MRLSHSTGSRRYSRVIFSGNLSRWSFHSWAKKTSAAYVWKKKMVVNKRIKYRYEQLMPSRWRNTQITYFRMIDSNEENHGLFWCLEDIFYFITLCKLLSEGLKTAVASVEELSGLKLWVDARMQPIKDNKKVLQLLKREWRRAKKKFDVRIQSLSQISFSSRLVRINWRLFFPFRRLTNCIFRPLAKLYCVLENCKKDGRHLWCFYHHSPFDIDTVASHPRSVLFDPQFLSILGSLIAFARLFEERLHTGWHQKEREKAPLACYQHSLGSWRWSFGKWWDKWSYHRAFIDCVQAHHCHMEGHRRSQTWNIFDK